MMSRSTLRWMLGLAIAGLAAACGDARSTPGNDPMTRTEAKTVTWSDGKPAIQINCGMPGDCQNRAIAMCRQSHGNYNVLAMDNMPTRGDASTVRGPASVVVRCT
jgi:hypothetical protein